MKKMITGFAAVLVAVGLLVGAPAPAQAQVARGYDRPVDVFVLGFWLGHTYHYYTPKGFKAFGGTTSGGHIHATHSYPSTTTSTCFDKSGNLTYAITGVCHQGTNRALYRTYIPWVRNFGDVGGAGTSYALFCDMGAGLWCYGAPC